MVWKQKIKSKMPWRLLLSSILFRNCLIWSSQQPSNWVGSAGNYHNFSMKKKTTRTTSSKTRIHGLRQELTFCIIPILVMAKSLSLKVLWPFPDAEMLGNGYFRNCSSLPCTSNDLSVQLNCDSADVIFTVNSQKLVNFQIMVNSYCMSLPKYWI